MTTLVTIAVARAANASASPAGRAIIATPVSTPCLDYSDVHDRIIFQAVARDILAAIYFHVLRHDCIRVLVWYNDNHLDWKETTR